MPLSKFIFRPGINREGTDYDNEGGWFDSNLIRFKNGRPQKIGGWAKNSSNSFLGTCRALVGWVNLDGNRYLGVGTHKKYYIESGNAFNDVTPLRLTTGSNEISFSASNGSSTLTVTDTGHGALKGDFVTYSGCATLGGVIIASALNQEYEIATITNDNVYTVTAKDTSGDTLTANSSDSGNGQGTIVGKYQVNVGLDVYVPSSGWGAGLWGASTFGEDLMLCPRAGGIYRWVENNGLTVRAVNLATMTGANLVPTVGLQVITSEVDRHLIVLGADPISGSSRTGGIDPMLIAFSDQENALDFEPLTTNTAGSLRLSSGSTIIGAVKSRQETLIWTDTSLYSMQFVGPPYTFGVNLINENTGLISPKGAITAPNGVFWMGYNNFYVYTGSVKKLPCTVLTYVFSDFNITQAHKVFAYTNTQFDEVGWYYTSSTSSELDRYVVYNYAEDVWSYGQLERTAWLDAGVETYPRATVDNYLYEHETGYNNDGSPMTNVFIESSDFDIGDGEQYAFINKIIPDLRFLNNSETGQVNMVLKTRNFPGDSLSTNSTSAISSTTQQTHIRARGRQAVLRIESDDDDTSANNDTGWRVGATRLEVRSDGRR